MAVIDRIPVTTPSRGMAISHVSIAIAIKITFAAKQKCSFAESLSLAQPAVKRELLGHLHHLMTNLAQLRSVVPALESLRDPSSNDAHLRLLHSACRQRRRSDANAAGFHRRVGVVRNRVLVDGNSCLSQRVLRL